MYLTLDRNHSDLLDPFQTEMIPVLQRSSLSRLSRVQQLTLSRITSCGVPLIFPQSEVLKSNSIKTQVFARNVPPKSVNFLNF